MPEDQKRTPEALAQSAAANLSATADRQVDPRAVTASRIQDAILAILKPEVVDVEQQTCDAELVVQCLVGTLIPFAVMGQMSEDQICDQIRVLYRQVATTMQLGRVPDRIIIPGRD